MYKQNNKTPLEQSKSPFLWLKRKCILLITAFMIGMANGMSEGDKMTNGNQHYTEQHKKE